MGRPSFFSAWLGGIGPGLLAAVLGVLAVDYFLTPPLYAFSLDIDDLARLAVFAPSAVLVGWLSVRRTRVEDALRRSHDELEVRVQERTADLTRSNQQLHAEVDARKRAEHTLREHAALLDLTHDTVFVRDVNDMITYWNRGAEELYGWSRKEAVGKNSHDLNQTVFPAPWEDIKAELIRTGRWEGELIHTRRDGTKVVVASRWSLQRDDQGRPAGTLETNNDITERKRAEEALQGSQAELAHVTRVTTLGELAASIAHEINQPPGGHRRRRQRLPQLAGGGAFPRRPRPGGAGGHCERRRAGGGGDHPDSGPAVAIDGRPRAV